MQQEDVGIWNERYRPRDASDILGNEHLREKLGEYVESRDVPHLLFFGPAGTGKSTSAKVLAEAVSEEYLYLNASDESGIDTIRNKVKRFCSSFSVTGDLKIVILDEADFLTPNSMACLRNIMEEFHESSRFILTANYIHKIIDPIQSRCQVFELRGAPKKDILKRVCQILTNEGVTFTIKPQVVAIINAFYPDIRRMINACQQLTTETDEGLVLQDVGQLEQEQQEILELITQGSTGALRDAIAKKSWVLEDLYRYIFDHAEDLTDSPEDVMLVVAEYLHRHSTVVDQRINFIACCLELRKVIA